MKKRKNYVNNEEFLKKIKKYKKEYKAGAAHSVPDDIAVIIYNIATNLAKSPKFNGYTYKDEMICDGVLNCIEKIHNFSPRKSSNPFSYFTQIIYFAFLRRIKEETKHSYIKNQSYQDFIEKLQYENKNIKSNLKNKHYEDGHTWQKYYENIEKNSQENQKERKKI